jgi:hypothetical protein
MSRLILYSGWIEATVTKILGSSASLYSHGNEINLILERCNGHTTVNSSLKLGRLKVIDGISDSLHSSVGIVTWLRAGRSGFESQQGLKIFLFATSSRPALGPTQPPIQGVPGALSMGVRRLGREADHSSPSSAEVKNAWSCISTPPVRLHGVVIG